MTNKILKINEKIIVIKLVCKDKSFIFLIVMVIGCTNFYITSNIIIQKIIESCF